MKKKTFTFLPKTTPYATVKYLRHRDSALSGSLLLRVSFQNYETN